MTLPRLECVAAAAIMRGGGRPPGARRPGRLRAHPAPALRLCLRPRRRRPDEHGASRPSERAWRAVSGRRNGGARRARPPRKAAIGAGVPASVWAAQPPPPRRLRRRRLRRRDHPHGIAAATELARRLRIDAAHVITGHTHRAGPEERDADWPLPGGGHAPQHRQLGLRRRLPPPRRAARALLAGHRHLARGRRAAARACAC